MNEKLDCNTIPCNFLSPLFLPKKCKHRIGYDLLLSYKFHQVQGPLANCGVELGSERQANCDQREATFDIDISQYISMMGPTKSGSKTKPTASFVCTVLDFPRYEKFGKPVPYASGMCLSPGFSPMRLLPVIPSEGTGKSSLWKLIM